MPELGTVIAQAEASINGVLAAQLHAEGLEFQEEFRFHPTRRWRFDLAFPDVLLAVEVEGINHRKRDRYGRDLAKYNAAAQAGWAVLRYTAHQVHSRHAVTDILATLTARKAGPHR